MHPVVGRAQSRETNPGEEDQSGMWGGCGTYLAAHLPKSLASTGLVDFVHGKQNQMIQM